MKYAIKAKLCLPSISMKNLKANNKSHSVTPSQSISNLAEKVRIRKYVNLYSNITPVAPENSMLNITKPQHSAIPKHPQTTKHKNLSQTAPEAPCLNLQRDCSELVYEIQKAMSDKLELARDLSTYDYLFSKQFGLHDKLMEINNFTKGISELGIDSDDLKIIGLICKKFDEISGNQRIKVEENVESESFRVKPVLYSKDKHRIFTGTVVISDIPCMIQILGTKSLEEMEINILLSSGTHYSLSIRHNTVNKDVLSKLYFLYYSSHNRLSLVFNPSHGEDFIVIIYSIRGYGKCALSLSVSNERLNIQVVEQKEILEVPEEVLKIKNLKEINVKKVKSIVKDYIYYDTYTKGFYWQDEKDLSIVFGGKESQSKLFDDDYLKEALSMKSFKIIYCFNLQVAEHQFRVEMQGFKDQIRCVIFFGYESVEIPQESRYFKVLVELQSFDILKASCTLQKSLEMSLCIRKQFPRLFISKTK